MYNRKAFAARILVLAMVLGMAPIGAGTQTEAAKKPKLSTKKVTIQKGKKKKVTVKNAKKYKVSWKVKKKKIVTFKKSGKYGVKLTAKKVGKTTLTATLKKGKKKKTLKCSVTVKKKSVNTSPTPSPTPKPTPTATLAPTATPTPALPSLKKAYAGLIDNIGTCITYNQPWGEHGQQMQEKDCMDLVDNHYNSFTLENEMKPESVLGSQMATLISKEEAKKLGYCLDGYKEEQVPLLNLENVRGALAIAKEHGIRMRAHTLLWHQQTPEWFFKKGYANDGGVVDKATMNARLEFFVRTVVSQVCAMEKELTGEAGSLVYCWDVVNEYVHRSNAPKPTTWVDVYGDMGLEPSYVKDAFRFAYDELTKAGIQDKVTLFYNDYDTYFSVEDEIALVNFINRDEKNKICGGIGMQSHVDIKRPTIEQYKTALEAFLKTGLEVQITELDITINFDTDETDGREPTFMYKPEKETNEDQAAYTKDLMKVIVDAQKNRDKSVNPKGITGITVWGLYDSVSWRNSCKPLLFEKKRVKNPETNRYNYIIQPKPSFYAFLQAPTL